MNAHNWLTYCALFSIRLQLPTPLAFIGCLLWDPSPIPRRRIICRPISGYIWFLIVIRRNDRAILYRYQDIAWYYVKSRKIFPPSYNLYFIACRSPPLFNRPLYQIWWKYRLIIIDEHYCFRFSISFHITSDGV